MKSDGCFAARTFPRWSLVIVVLLAGLDGNLATAQPAGAAKTVDKGVKATDLRGEWQRAGAGFACKVAPGKLPPELIKPDILTRACLHLGPFVIGDDAQALTTALGAPHRSLPQPNGAVASIYFLETADHHPYLVATVAKQKIIALQVTGPVAAKGYDFNHIDLGVSTDTLIRYFGQPNHLDQSTEKDTDLWTYRPWPFSFEVKGGHVTSIRIAEPN
jgi:hypothetical protein